MPRVAKKSTSFVKAAFMTSGAPATMGQLALSIVSVDEVRHVREDREEDVLERLLRPVCWWKSRLWMCACATFDG